MSAIIIEQASRFLDFSHLTELDGIDVVDGVPKVDVTELEEDFPAASNSGSYGVVLTLDGDPSFYQSDGTTWQPVGSGFVAGGLLYPNMSAVIAAGLADGTRVESPNGSRLWAIKDSYPLPAGIYKDGTYAVELRIVGTEADETAAGVTQTGVTAATEADAGVFWQAGASGDYVQLKTLVDADQAALTFPTVTAQRQYFSAMVAVPNVDTDATKGYSGALIRLASTSYGIWVFPASDAAGARVSVTSSAPYEGGVRRDEAFGSTFRFIEIDANLESDGGHVLWVDGRLTQVVHLNQSVGGDGRIGNSSSSTGGATTSLWKHLTLLSYS